MLNTNVDYALVGHNFITFLLSLGLLQRGKSVLVLDDDRFNYGEFFTNSLTALDVQFLKAWGSESQLGPLKNLDDYLSPETLTFYVGKKQILLGDRPHDNYRELCRKFPHLFFEKEKDWELFSSGAGLTLFDGHYYDFCQKTTNALFSEQKNKRLSFLMEQSLSPELKARFIYFLSHFNHQSDVIDAAVSEFKSLVFMTRGFFQNRLSPTGSQSELLHLFISLISPYYKLDHTRLINDLKKEHMEKGGEFKKLNLADLKLNRGIVTSFELDSFEGVIKPQKMAFIGGHPMGLPIKLATQSKSYSCLNVNLSFASAVPVLLQNKKFVFTSAIKMGTDRPFWEVSFGHQSAVFNVILTRREGSKVEFIHERVIDILIADLQFLYPEYSFTIVEASMNYTRDVFIQDFNYDAHLKKEKGFSNKIVDVLEERAPLMLSRLKNVLYFGPYNENALGTFSSLVEIKKWQQTL